MAIPLSHLSRASQCQESSTLACDARPGACHAVVTPREPPGSPCRSLRRRMDHARHLCTLGEPATRHNFATDPDAWLSRPSCGLRGWLEGFSARRWAPARPIVQCGIPE